MSAGQELQPHKNSSLSIEETLSTESLVGQVRLIQEAMKSVMKKDEHYGTIPGCGNKPTLLKPGAEKLSLLFRMAPRYIVDKESSAGGHREYMVRCVLEHVGSGNFLGEGLGSCSTMEGKYRFRTASKKCPECGKETIIKGRAEYGGGWLCYATKGGCGEKWDDGDKAIEGQVTGRVEHDNPADYYNTVLKMAKKRAHVDAVLTATAASDIFTQDVEDLPVYDSQFVGDVGDTEGEVTNGTPPETPPSESKLGGVAKVHLESIRAAMTVKDLETIAEKLKAQKRVAPDKMAMLRNEWKKKKAEIGDMGEEGEPPTISSEPSGSYDDLF